MFSTNSSAPVKVTAEPLCRSAPIPFWSYMELVISYHTKSKKKKPPLSFAMAIMLHKIGLSCSCQIRQISYYTSYLVLGLE